MQESIKAFAERFFEMGFYSMDLTFVLCTVVLLGHFERDVRVMARRVGDFLALLMVEGLLCLGKYLLTGDAGSMPVFVVIIVGYALLQHDLLTTDKLARCSTFMAALVLLTGITGVLAPAITVLRDVSWGSGLPNLLSFAALLAVSLYLRRYPISEFRYVPRDYARLVVAVCVVAAASGWAFIAYNDARLAADQAAGVMDESADIVVLSTVNLVVDVGLLVLVLISYHMFYLLSKEHERRGANLVIRRHDSDSADTIGVTKTVYEQMREVRHETRNHVAYMQALLEAGDYERLGAYFQTFKADTAGFLSYVQSGNEMVDAVVNAKIALANSQGVEVKTMLAVPQELGFAEEDLFSLVANLMDNAIEGAVASEAPSKVVSLSIRPEGGYYIVTVQNPCAHTGDASGSLSQLKTTKADKDVHGFGTRVVSRIARRHKGTARYQVRDDVFTVNVMLAQDARGAGADAGQAEEGGA